MAKLIYNGDEFEMYCEMLDVTSLHRPDPRWHFVDVHGHVHRWHDEDGPAMSYNPQKHYRVPSMVKVVTGTRVDEDGEEHEDFHFECLACPAIIEPGYTADTCTQLIPGLRYYCINGQTVSPEEFERRLPPIAKPRP